MDQMLDKHGPSTDSGIGSCVRREHIEKNLSVVQASSPSNKAFGTV